MKLRLTLSAVLAAGAFFTSLPAYAECRCVANGVRYSEGELACLKTPNGPRLARCGKVLNNSSWKLLEDGCQQISQSLPDQKLLFATSLEKHPANTR